MDYRPDTSGDLSRLGGPAHQVVSVLLALLAAALSLRLLQVFFQRRHRHQTFERMGVPGPKPHPISGQLYETRRQPYVRFAHRLHQKFGKTVGFYLGGDPYLATKDLELIQQVFISSSRHFYNRMHFYLNVDPVPDNLICQRGDRWRYMRRLLTPAFSSSRVRSVQFYRDTQQTVDKLFGQIRSAANSNKTLLEDLYDRMAAVALDVIVKTAFHMDDVIRFDGSLAIHTTGNSCRGDKAKPEWDSNKGERPVKPVHDSFLATVKRASRLGFNPLVELIFCFPFLDKPLTKLCTLLYFTSIMRLLFYRLDQLVRRPNIQPVSGLKGSQLTDGSWQGCGTPKRRIVDSLVEVLRQRKISMNEFRGNAFVIVFAGFETTANALTFTLWLLARHQSVQSKLREQIRGQLACLRSKSNETTNCEQNQAASDEQMLDAELAELATGCEYLEMVLNESLRLYPPVPGLSCRQASQDCILANGLHIERGVNIVPSVYSIHRDVAVWGPDASHFRPERFETLSQSQLNSAMFMPFGLGPRNCIGKNLAMHEMKIVIGRIVQHYSIESQSGKTPEKLRLCSPINITITNSEPIGVSFVRLPSE